MRTKPPADALFPGARRKILAALCLHPKRAWHLSHLARHVGSPKTSLQRELASLEAAGILVRRAEGRQVYYQANPACPFMPELQGLMAKTSGIVDVIRDALKGVRGIEIAFIFGSIAKGDAVSESDVDLMVIGSVRPIELMPAVERMFERLSRPVNPTVMPVDEAARKATGQGFFARVLHGPKLFVVGDGDGLGAITGTAEGRAG